MWVCKGIPFSFQVYEAVTLSVKNGRASPHRTLLSFVSHQQPLICCLRAFCCPALTPPPKGNLVGQKPPGTELSWPSSVRLNSHVVLCNKAKWTETVVALCPTGDESILAQMINTKQNMQWLTRINGLGNTEQNHTPTPLFCDQSLLF